MVKATLGKEQSRGRQAHALRGTLLILKLKMYFVSTSFLEVFMPTSAISQEARFKGFVFFLNILTGALILDVSFL